MAKQLKTTAINVRVTPETKEALNKLTEEEQRKTGYSVSQADIVTALIMAATKQHKD